jgi:long-chain acyl-CoA synthetase
MPSLSSIVRNVMAIDPAAPALEYGKVWHSWGELTGIIEAIEGIYKVEGIAPGTRIGGILRNTPQIAAVIIGTIINDRCIVTLNPSLPDSKLANDITNLKTPVIIALSADWQRPEILEAARVSGALCLEVTGDVAAPVKKIFDKTGTDFLSDANGIGIEMLSSGTTGTPKRIPLKSENFSKMVLDAAVFENRDLDAAPKLSRAVSIANTPFAHIGGIFGLFLTLSAGRKACLLDRFRVEEFVDAIQRHQPKVVAAPPSALRMILDAKVPKDAFSSLAVFRTSMAPLDPAMAQQFYDIYGVPILQNYGATEFAGGVAGWTMSDFKKYGSERIGSVGRMNPGIEGRVVDTETVNPFPSVKRACWNCGRAILGTARIGYGQPTLREWMRRIFSGSWAEQTMRLSAAGSRSSRMMWSKRLNRTPMSSKPASSPWRTRALDKSRLQAIVCGQAMPSLKRLCAPSCGKS